MVIVVGDQIAAGRVAGVNHFWERSAMPLWKGKSGNGEAVVQACSETGELSGYKPSRGCLMQLGMLAAMVEKTDSGTEQIGSKEHERDWLGLYSRSTSRQ